ncbi:hypothetical protein SB6419_01647 [Klebsiella spallanzanii]|nr:hypothetical protein SB6419_01647 [Klebsiella spallanzanii]
MRLSGLPVRRQWWTRSPVSEAPPGITPALNLYFLALRFYRII